MEISGILSLEVPHEPGQDVLAGNRAATDHELAEHASLEAIDGLPGLPTEGEDPRGVSEQQLTRPGRRGAAPQAIQQLDPQVLLERANVLGDRRLCEEQCLGGAGEASQLGDLGEDLESAKVHETEGVGNDSETGRGVAPSGRRTRGDQWQAQPPPQQPPPEPTVEATGLPSLLRPNTDSFRLTSPLAHVGHATAVAAECTYFSKSFPQPRQRYS